MIIFVVIVSVIVIAIITLCNTIFVPGFQVLYFNCLCLKPIEKRLHSAQTLILWTQPRKISYLLWQNKEIFTFCSRGEIKNNTCMVSRQRQSNITQKGSEMSSFSRFASVQQIPFSKKLPNVGPHHLFVILFLVTMFKVHYILMKALASRLWVSSHVLLFSKMILHLILA